MRSRTSCFNPTLLKKNVTRFAPVWGLYTLCLIMGTVLLYSNGGTGRAYHFAANVADLASIMGVINLFYAPVVAQLLFGDLYNSRMCYALHAMPVRREAFLVTNVVSGFLFSLVPTLVMAVVSVPLMAGSCFVNAWQIPLYVLAAGNLEFVCFFGMSVLCVMCTGNRLTMAMIYGLLNFGAVFTYWMIDTIYTPMLYGVITPSTLAENLTPIYAFNNHRFIETDTYGKIYEMCKGNWSKAVANFHITEEWHILFIWAAAGVAMLALALVLYRKRHLECAGDALAFKKTEPVFQVIVAVVSACFVEMFLDIFIGYNETGVVNYLFMWAGLAVGWFACRMLIERSTRVFRGRNFLGLLGLTAALAASLVATELDVLGIETWQPRLENIESIGFGNYSDSVELTEEEDFARVLALQEEALEDRLQYDGPYVTGLDGSWVYNIDTNSALIGKSQWDITDCRFAFDAHITYRLKSGKVVTRKYTLWSDGPGADAAREYLSSWEGCLLRENDHLDQILRDVTRLAVDGMEDIKDPDPELVYGLIEAIKRDCEAHTMAPNAYLHTGYFERADEEWETGIRKDRSIGIYISDDEYGWWIDIFPDSANTVKYLQDNGLLAYEIVEQNLHYN